MAACRYVIFGAPPPCRIHRSVRVSEPPLSVILEPNSTCDPWKYIRPADSAPWIGASSYTFAEATWTQSLSDWISATSHIVPFGKTLGLVPRCGRPAVGFQESSHHDGLRSHRVCPLRPLHPHLVQEASGSTPGATVSPRWQHADANVSQHIQRPRIEALDGGLDAQQSRLPFAVAPTLSGNRRPAGRRSRSPPGGICGNSEDIKPRVDGSHGETDVTGSPAKRFRGMTSGASSAPSMSTNTFPHGASHCLTTCAQAGGQGVREFNRTLDGRANGHSPARRSSRNCEPGSTPVTSRRSRARVQAT